MKVIITEKQLKQVASEAIFLKKNDADQTLHLFSDKPTKNERAKETIPLARNLRNAGFDFKSELGHWVGNYSNLQAVNDLIRKHNKTEEFVKTLENIENFVAESDIDPAAKNLLMDKLTMYINDLANATDQAAMDAIIRNYLSFFSKFHKYSLTNSWLIFIQKNDATTVASYNTWKKNHRGVKKGATAIHIFFPIMQKTTEREDEPTDFSDVDNAVLSNKPIRYGIGKVYDISDTYALDPKGEEPKEPIWYGENEPSEIADELINRIKQFIELNNIKLTKSDSKSGEKGYSANEHINLSSDVSGVGEASTLIHELAHELLHWSKSPFYVDDPEYQTRAMKELQAESVSYAVLKHYQLPVTHHPTYLTLWKANSQKIMKNLNIIIKCSKYIIDGIDSM